MRFVFFASVLALATNSIELTKMDDDAYDQEYASSPTDIGAKTVQDTLASTNIPVAKEIKIRFRNPKYLDPSTKVVHHHTTHHHTHIHEDLDDEDLD